MQLYISHLISNNDLFNILSQYPSVGIESIEFSISSVLDQGEKAISAYADQLGSYLSDRPFGLHGPFFDLSPASFDSCIRKVTMQRFNTVYAIAKKLGAAHIVFHTGFLPQVFYPEGWLSQSIPFWQEFMKDKDDSIAIYLENVFETDYKPLLEVLKSIQHPSFSCCLDVGHVNAYSPLSIEEWLSALGPYIGHFHLHNNDSHADAHQSLLTGTLNFTALLPNILKTAPAASATLEMNHSTALTDSLDFLFKHFSQLSI